MKKWIAFLLSIAMPMLNWAQCAMCRTQIKNNVSAGDTSMAEGLNNGIMFLFFTPYVVVFVIIFLWYRNSKVVKHVSINKHLKG